MSVMGPTQLRHSRCERRMTLASSQLIISLFISTLRAIECVLYLIRVRNAFFLGWKFYHQQYIVLYATTNHHRRQWKEERKKNREEWEEKRRKTTTTNNNNNNRRTMGDHSKWPLLIYISVYFSFPPFIQLLNRRLNTFSASSLFSSTQSISVYDRDFQNVTFEHEHVCVCVCATIVTFIDRHQISHFDSEYKREEKCNCANSKQASIMIFYWNVYSNTMQQHTWEWKNKRNRKKNKNHRHPKCRYSTERTLLNPKPTSDKLI